MRFCTKCGGGNLQEEKIHEATVRLCGDCKTGFLIVEVPQAMNLGPLGVAKAAVAATKGWILETYEGGILDLEAAPDDAVKAGSGEEGQKKPNIRMLATLIKQLLQPDDLPMLVKAPEDELTALLDTILKDPA